MPSRRRLQAVAETRAFSEDIDAMLSPEDREALITAIAADPAGGAFIPGAGGLRKRRIALPGRGKSGGARIITLYLGENWPVYAVYAYAKSERETLSPGQARNLARLVGDIKLQARRKKGT
ncbi:MAG: type II toxin-antitoxin system RelE/ParE family toxin [Hyphomicrobiales bacterium]|nr:type II toxin-antitoxin system RelE/ParE family toxin [Hyphomicrobiales bacterium]